MINAISHSGWSWSLWLLWTITHIKYAWGLDGMPDCAISCFDDVSRTGCEPAEWSCLCKDSIYNERVNQCVYSSCSDPNSEEEAFDALGEICNVFRFPVSEENAPVSTAPERTLSGSASELADEVSSAVVSGPSSLDDNATTTSDSQETTSTSEAATTTTPTGDVSEAEEDGSSEESEDSASTAISVRFGGADNAVAATAALLGLMVFKLSTS